ncbi:MAG TPA: tetratricopeptide repeat protein [Thermohalobaculum sp.]|nr:tetratricopeptide repeat protein [Thermohalobaculum sp.]
MRRWLSAALLAASAALAPATGGASEVENLLRLCSDQQTPAHDALNACRRAAQHGRLDARTRALAWLNAGIAAYALGRHSQAVASHSAAIEADPGLGRAFENRALAQEKLGRAEAALSDYAAAISLDPRNAGAYLGRGNLMLGQGRAERALADFTRAAELDPALAAAHYNRGVALMRLRRHAEAEAAFARVIGRDPTDAGAWLGRGRARAEQDKPGALNDFDRAVTLRPEWANAWYARGRYLDALGRTEAANTDLMRAYRLGYSDAWLIERVGRISGR